MVASWMLWCCYGLGMDVFVIVCSRNTNVIMVSSWMLRCPSALVTRTLVWLRHGCSGDRVLYENELDYGCGMDALMTAFPRKANVIMDAA